MKKRIGGRIQVQKHPPALTERFEVQVEPEIILGVWNSELVVDEWLVKWKNMTESEPMWELIYLMKQQFPDFHLKDKEEQFEGDGIVRPPIVFTYKRKGKTVKGDDEGRRANVETKGIGTNGVIP